MEQNQKVLFSVGLGTDKVTGFSLSFKQWFLEEEQALKTSPQGTESSTPGSTPNAGSTMVGDVNWWCRARSLKELVSSWGKSLLSWCKSPEERERQRQTWRNLEVKPSLSVSKGQKSHIQTTRTHTNTHTLHKTVRGEWDEVLGDHLSSGQFQEASMAPRVSGTILYHLRSREKKKTKKRQH